MYVTVVNTLQRPVPIDQDGRQLPGGEWGAVDKTQPYVAAAIEAGHLLVVDKYDTANPELAAAFAATDKANTPPAAAPAPAPTPAADAVPSTGAQK